MGQYIVIKPLGKGGMGEVYLVEHSILRTQHALKLLPGDRSSDSVFISRFHDEARVMANLTHPGIVHVTHADESDDRHYLVMDFIGADGSDTPCDLEEALTDAPNGQLDPEHIVRLATQICAAVQSAHEKGVVHRDLKPANILLTSRDIRKADVRVADFGLARLVGEDWLRSQIDTSIKMSFPHRQGYGGQVSMGGMETMASPSSQRSSTGAILGTYEYMSPEQREGGEVDPRSDVFALGVMLYRMITGKRLVGRAKAASKIVQGLDERWDDLIDSCLEEDPDDRPAGMGGVSGQLSVVGCQLQGEDSQSVVVSGQLRERKEAEELQRREDTKVRKRKPQKPDNPGHVRGGGLFVIKLILVMLGVGGCLIYFMDRPKKSPASQTMNNKPRISAPQRPIKQTTNYKPPTSTAREGSPLSLDLGNKVKMDLVWISAGEFMMGSNSGDSDYKPQHKVKISNGFWMGKYEVTQKQYQQIMEKNPSHFTQSGLDAPVEKVSWNDAKEFCRKLKQLASGNGQLAEPEVRLPTEAEWEYACRAGTKTGFHYGNSLDSSMANFDGDYPYGSGKKGIYRKKTTAVGSFKPNAWGLYDMHGNVWEWCEDWYGKDYYEASPTTDPKGSSSGSDRVLRGGSWYNSAGSCRSAHRRRGDPTLTLNLDGFRVVVP